MLFRSQAPHPDLPFHAEHYNRYWAASQDLNMDDDELVNESYEIFSKAFIAAPYPNLPGMKVSFEYVAATRPDVWNHKPEEFADSSFIAELDKSGFIKSLYGK